MAGHMKSPRGGQHCYNVLGPMHYILSLLRYVSSAQCKNLFLSSVWLDFSCLVLGTICQTELKRYCAITTKIFAEDCGSLLGIKLMGRGRVRYGYRVIRRKFLRATAWHHVML